MTNADSRFDRIEAILERVASQQAELSNKQNIAQDQIITLESALVELANRQANTHEQLDELLTTATNIFNRDAVLNNVLLELQQSHEQHEIRFEEHQRRFEENQQTTNAALRSLEAILLQLIRRFPEG
jgi:ribonuclease D